MTDERPEALAQFAESARRGEQAAVTGLTAMTRTAPVPTDPKLKDEAATRVLAEGATGQDLAAEEYVDRLPDRIIESQNATREGEATPSDIPPYDATRDGRTGRPPQPLEAQQLAREHEVARSSAAHAGDQSQSTHAPKRRGRGRRSGPGENGFSKIG